MNKKIAMLLCLLMASASIAGCVGGDDDSTNESEDKLDDWNVHFAATSEDLPACDEITNGRLYYVESDEQFQVCKTSGWAVITIQGADGQDGAPGVDGADGQDGAPGVDGADGQDGAPGVDGADGQDGAPGVDGTDGQDGAPGAAGEKGDDGEDGISTLIRVLSSTGCTTGGNTLK